MSEIVHVVYLLDVDAHLLDSGVVINDLFGLKSFFPSETGALAAGIELRPRLSRVKRGFTALQLGHAHTALSKTVEFTIYSYMNDRAFLYSQHIHHHTDP